MLRIKTVSELKERLPEVIDRINTLKVYFDIDTMMLQTIQEQMIDGEGGYWGSLKGYVETFKNQTEHYAEIEYLQGLIDKYCK